MFETDDSTPFAHCTHTYICIGMPLKGTILPFGIDFGQELSFYFLCAQLIEAIIFVLIAHNWFNRLHGKCDSASKDS